MLDVFSYVEACSLVGAGLAIGLGAIGAAIGEGLTAGKANETLSYRPELAGDILKTMLVGQAVAESAAIFALVVAMLMLFADPVGKPLLAAWAYLGSGLGMGLSAIGSGIGSGFVSADACEGIGRQPAAKGPITSLMLIGAAIAQTPAVLGMVVAFLLMFMDFSTKPLYPYWATYLAAGLSIGLSAIGPATGEGYVAKKACAGLARNPEAQPQITTTMLVGMAVTESTAIYGFLVSLMLLFISFPESTDISRSLALLGAGLAMGFGGIGPGIGEGLTGSFAVTEVARNPAQASLFTRTMLVGQAVAESTGIYALIVALLLIMVV